MSADPTQPPPAGGRERHVVVVHAKSLADASPRRVRLSPGSLLGRGDHVDQVAQAAAEPVKAPDAS